MDTRLQNHLVDAGRFYPQAWRVAEKFPGAGSGLYSCYSLKMGVGSVQVETFPDNDGKKKDKT